MADLAEHDPQTPGQEDQAAANAAAALDSSRKRRAPDDDDDDDEKPGRERRKIDIKFITDKSRRHITFSKRKAGIMKKVSAVMRRDGDCHGATQGRRVTAQKTRHAIVY